MNRFKKEILRPGRYFAQGRYHEVTPKDIRAYAQNFHAMRKAELHVPVLWEHPDLTAAEGDPRKSRDVRADMARHTIGFLDNVTKEKGRLYGHFSAEVKEDAERLKAHKFVSPKLSGKWTDGSGKSWDKVINHVAVTPIPVQAQQDGFQQTAETPEGVAAFSLLNLSKGDEMTDLEESQDAVEEIAENAEEEEYEAEETVEKEVAQGDPVDVEELKQELATFDPPILLPDHTTKDDLCEHLLIAVKAAKAALNPAPEEGDMDQDDEEFMNEDANMIEEAPPMAALSKQLEDQKSENAVLFSHIQNDLRDRLTGRIKKLHKQMIISDKKRDEWLEEASKVQFSVTAEGIGKSALETRIEDHEGLRPGAILSAGDPRMAKLFSQSGETETVGHPDLDGNPEQPTDEDTVKEFMKMSGG